MLSTSVVCYVQTPYFMCQADTQMISFELKGLSLIVPSFDPSNLEGSLDPINLPNSILLQRGSSYIVKGRNMKGETRFWEHPASFLRVSPTRITQP